MNHVFGSLEVNETFETEFQTLHYKMFLLKNASFYWLYVIPCWDATKLRFPPRLQEEQGLVRRGRVGPSDHAWRKYAWQGGALKLKVQAQRGRRNQALRWACS